MTTQTIKEFKKEYPVWKKLLDLILGFISGGLGFMALFFLFNRIRPSMLTDKLFNFWQNKGDTIGDLLVLVIFVLVYVLYLILLFKIIKKSFPERNFLKIGLNILIAITTILIILIISTVGSCNFPFNILPLT